MRKMKKTLALLLVMFAFIVYLKNGQVIKADDVDWLTGLFNLDGEVKYQEVLSVTTHPHSPHVFEIRFYPRDQVDHFEPVSHRDNKNVEEGSGRWIEQK